MSRGALQSHTGERRTAQGLPGTVAAQASISRRRGGCEGQDLRWREREDKERAEGF